MWASGSSCWRCCRSASTTTILRHLLIMVFVYGVVAFELGPEPRLRRHLQFRPSRAVRRRSLRLRLLTKLAGLNPWLALLAGGFAAALAAALISVPILRLKGIYIVLVSFAFGQLVLQLIISQSDLTGGNSGLGARPDARHSRATIWSATPSSATTTSR